MSIKKILFSQDKPANFEKTPYADLKKNYKVDVDFFKFFSIEGVPLAEFRKQRINILDYSAIIMTSKNAIDQFFRIVEECKIKLPITTKYFCVNSATANYLQTYTVYRKRKIFFSEDGSPEKLVKEIEQHVETDKFLVPCCSDTSLNQLLALLDTKPAIKYDKAELFKIHFNDLTQVDIYGYDMIVLFSRHGVQSLFNSYPDFHQKEGMHFAALGEVVVSAAEEAGLTIETYAPQPGITSIFMALEKYLKQENRRRR